MIAIISSPTDPTANRVSAHLDARGAENIRVDFASFPNSTRAAAGVSADGVRTFRWLDPAMAPIVAAPDIIWWRRPGTPTVSPMVSAPGAADFATSESADFLEDLWNLDGVAALPAPRPVLHRVQRKLYQLAIAAELGWDMADTLVTNDASAVAAFMRRRGALRLISKQVGFTQLAHQQSGDDSLWDSYARYTERVTARDIAHLGSIAHCPIILQAEVAKRFELRVTLVGERLFAVAIHSQHNPRTSLDWRRYDDRATPYELVDLPADVAARCRAMARRLGLRYGAFDIIVDRDGRYIFVEVNPSGEFLWLEDLTGAPISAAIADELCRSVPAAEVAA